MPLSDAEYKKRYGQTRKQAEAARKKTRASKAYKTKKAELESKRQHPRKKLKASDMPAGWAVKKKSKPKAAPKKKEDTPGTRVKNSDGRFSYPGTSNRKNPPRKPAGGGGSGSTGTGGGRAKYG